MRTTTTTTKVTVTIPNHALVAAEALLVAVRELAKAGGSYELTHSGTSHELTHKALICLVCEMLDDGDPADEGTLDLAQEVVSGVIESGNSVPQHLVLELGWTVIPIYEELGGDPVVEPERNVLRAFREEQWRDDRHHSEVMCLSAGCLSDATYLVSPPAVTTSPGVVHPQEQRPFCTKHAGPLDRSGWIFTLLSPPTLRDLAMMCEEIGCRSPATYRVVPPVSAIRQFCDTHIPVGLPEQCYALLHPRKAAQS